MSTLNGVAACKKRSKSSLQLELARQLIKFADMYKLSLIIIVIIMHLSWIDI